MKKLVAFVWKLVLWLVALTFAGAAIAVFFVQRTAPYERGEAETLVKALQAGAQLELAHQKLDEGKTRAANVALFEKVERGDVLTDDESLRYRALFEAIFDGARGRRDRWDRERGAGNGLAAPRANLRAIAEVIERLRGLGEVGAPYERTKYAISGYKDALDVVTYAAAAANLPATAYAAPGGKPQTPVETHGEAVLEAAHAAQREPINSPGYRAAVDRAAAAAVELVLATQAGVDPRLGWFERKLAGPFAGWQSLAPLHAPRGTPPTRAPAKHN